MIFEGTKCKVCNQQLGIYCERCLPDQKCTRQDHHKVDHAFKPLIAAHSHIYSKAILLDVCGGRYECDGDPHKDILQGYLSKPKTITPGDCSWNLPECRGVTVQPVILKTNLENTTKVNTALALRLVQLTVMLCSSTFTFTVD